MHNGLPSEEERRRLRRKLEEDALALARESKWDEAAAKNREVLGLDPRDVSAMNRLGKALMEQGHYRDAREIYSQALALDPMNQIARKNVDRLAKVPDADQASRPAERIDPRLFIGETGKTGYTSLVALAGTAVLAHISIGDQVYLQRQGQILYVSNSAGEHIGRVEPRLASRLIKAIEGGNEYAAAITDSSSSEVLVIVRESFQAPAMIGQVVFTPEDSELKRGERTEAAEDADDADEAFDEGEEDGDEEEEGDGEGGDGTEETEL